MAWRWDSQKGAWELLESILLSLWGSQFLREKETEKQKEVETKVRARTSAMMEILSQLPLGENLTSTPRGILVDEKLLVELLVVPWIVLGCHFSGHEILFIWGVKIIYLSIYQSNLPSTYISGLILQMALVCCLNVIYIAKLVSLLLYMSLKILSILTLEGNIDSQILSIYGKTLFPCH